ncbi:MAG TPA: carbohydrate-binding family 9-like protein [Chryseolinea sp.]|nr:carbohydrate-binding family 9-like protein [Chryseolinea sp.]
MHKILIKSLLCLIVIVQSAIAQNSSGVILIKHTNDFDLNGQGKNKAWDAASWNLMMPSEKGDLRKTQFKVLYSDKGIYFLFHNEDRLLTATKTADYEKLWLEDVIEVFLWPDTTETLYFEYEISPLNYELPLLIPNLNGTFFGWIPWQYDGVRKVVHYTNVTGGEKKSGSKITSWDAEFFIPFKLMVPLSNVPPKSGTTWRGNMYRIDYDAPTTVRWHWKPVETNFHQFSKFGVLLFE